VDAFHHLISGFAVILTPANLYYCLLGSLVGTLVGVLPGIGPLAALSLLLPVTFNIPATSSMVMLSAIFYGAMYGGSTTSILVNIPGGRPRSSPAWTGTRWPRRAGPGRRWASPPSARSSPARSAPSG
jgi:TctA family transporter